MLVLTRKVGERILVTEYGLAFPSVVIRDNVVATQFHPEKSGRHGLRLYANFGRLVRAEPGQPGRTGATVPAPALQRA